MKTDDNQTSASSEGEHFHDGPEDFSAVKHDLHAGDAHGGGHGGTEMGWLVSYADMMTLLFGLFVILYSLRTDKTKDADAVMKQISNQFFKTPTEPKKETPKITQEMLDAVKVQLKAETIKSQQIQMQLQIVMEQKQELEAEKKILSQKLEKPVTKIEPKIELERENKELKLQSETLKEENKKLITQLKLVEAQIKPPQREPQSVPIEKVEEVEQQLNAIKSENEQLKKELASTQRNAQTYLMIVLAWETEKHDLDLSIETPSQKVFDFKHRQIRGEHGEFQIDSRYGPGIEMWKAENFQSGRYKIKSSFYNTNGNAVNAKVRLSVITNAQTYRSEVIEIPITKKNFETDVFVDEKGKIQVR